MSDTALLRIGILAAGVLLIAAILLFGRPRKPAQGKRREPAESGERPRREPVLGAGEEAGEGVAGAEAGDAATQQELGLPEVEAPGSELGRRATQDFDKIVSLYVAARAGLSLRGEDIVVAAEKTGLVFGYMNVFHRMVEGHPERGPIFSMASIMKPGSFDMAHIREMETPAIAFFLTLPGRRCCPPCSAWPNCSTAWSWTTAATRWGASASPTSATNCGPTTASTRRHR